MGRHLNSTAPYAFVAVVVVGLLFGPTWADDAAPAAKPSAGDNELHEIMEQLGENFRSLRRSVRTPEQSAETRAYLHKMESLAVRAKALQPKQAATLQGDELGAFNRSFQLQMITLLEKTLATERAVLESRHDAAADLVKEIYIVQRDAHSKFRVGD